MLKRFKNWHDIILFFVLVGVFLFGGWGSGQTPGSDGATYIYQALRMVESGEIVFRGYYSLNPLGHPGPILFWILGAGMFIGKMFGGDLILWASIFYALFVALCITIGGNLLYKATSSLIAWSFYYVGVIYLIASNQPWSETPVNGMAVWPMYGPSLGAVISLVGVISAYGVLKRNGSGWALALMFGGMMIQISIETLLVGVFVVGTGIFGLIKTKKIFIHQVPLILLGIGPLIGRWVNEGADFPLRYVQKTLETVQRDGERQGADLKTILYEALGRVNNLSLIFGILIIGVFVLMYKKEKKRGEAGFLFLFFLQLSLVIFFTSRAHQAASIGSYYIVLIALTFREFSGKIHKKLSQQQKEGTTNEVLKKHITPRLKTIICIVVSLIVIGVGSVHFGINKPGGFYTTNTWTEEISREIHQTLGEGSKTLGLITSVNDLPLSEVLGASRGPELYLSLTKNNIKHCAQSQMYDTGLGPERCLGAKPDSWLVIRAFAGEDIEEGQTYEKDSTWVVEEDLQEGEGYRLYIKLIDNLQGDSLSKEGFKYCENLGMVWVYLDTKAAKECLQEAILPGRAG